jgi:hypothetical protein
MSAVLVTGPKNDMFKNAGAGEHIIKIPSVDDIVAANAGIAMYNTVSAKLSETIQYFLTFDDVTKVIHFGKAVGSLNVEGTLFSTCSGEIPGMSKFSAAFYALRGNVVDAVIGNISVKIIMSDAQVTIVGHPDTLADFSFQFSIVDH